MDTIIIDAYNLMHKVSELRILLAQSQDICVDAMVGKLNGHFFNRGVKVILVFDGLGMNKHDHNIEVKFARTGAGTDWGNADALIKHLVDKAKNPKLVRIVSSDRDITWYAKDRGCRIQTAESFWGEVKDRRIERAEEQRDEKEKPSIVSRTEYDYLLKEFTKK
jgi:predicted RNA-binding protein with PIN domain